MNNLEFELEFTGPGAGLIGAALVVFCEKVDQDPAHAAVELKRMLAAIVDHTSKEVTPCTKS